MDKALYGQVNYPQVEACVGEYGVHIVQIRVSESHMDKPQDVILRLTVDNFRMLLRQANAVNAKLEAMRENG